MCFGGVKGPASVPGKSRCQKVCSPFFTVLGPALARKRGKVTQWSVRTLESQAALMRILTPLFNQLWDFEQVAWSFLSQFQEREKQPLTCRNDFPGAVSMGLVLLGAGPALTPGPWPVPLSRNNFSGHQQRERQREALHYGGLWGRGNWGLAV